MPKPAASAIIRRPDVLRLTGLSYSTIYRAMRAGKFPARIRLGENSVGWREADVLAWIDSREPVTTEPVTAP
jgi:prophage regulatory protein